MDNELHILILEDVATDAELIEHELKSGGFKFVSMRVETKEAFTKALTQFKPDIILSDYKLPLFDGLAALTIVKEKFPALPLIFVSGAIGEEFAIESVKKGATDYVLKERLSRLIPAVRRALQEAEDHTERKKAQSNLVRRDYQMEVLSRTSQHINMVLEVPVIMRTLVTAAKELVSATGGMAGLLKEREMVFSEYSSEVKVKPISYIFKAGEGIPGMVIESKKPYISNDAEHDPHITPAIKNTFGLYNLVNVPILSGKSELMGCFEIHNKEDHELFDAQDIFMLQGLAASAAVALGNANMLIERVQTAKELEGLNKELLRSNKKLRQVALKDTQTGLYNHSYLAEFIEPELYRAKRYGHPLSVIMLDIDYFKSINDLYGHRFGDLVLKQFATYLKKMVRRYDIVVRFGGEEFVIISPGSDRMKAQTQARRLFDAINLRNFGNKKHDVKLKVSVGIASYPEDKIIKGIDLLNLADKIIDKVKDAGGNKVYSSLDINNGPALAPEGAPTKTAKFLKERIRKLTKRGKQSLIESIFAFAKTIELRDHYTGEHVENTVRYSTAIARELRIPSEEIENIRQASILHDLGKVGISDKILLKKGPLGKKEFEEIKKHPQIAADIIRPIQFMREIVPLVLYHHERWDGKGYPSGLKGEEIPIGARIIAIADVYQALTSNRPYRKAFSEKKAMGIIRKGSGTQFDPRIAETFLRVLKKIK